MRCCAKRDFLKILSGFGDLPKKLIFWPADLDFSKISTVFYHNSGLGGGINLILVSICPYQCKILDFEKKCPKKSKMADFGQKVAIFGPKITNVC